MKWNDFLQISRVRAVEEADAREGVWDGAAARAGTLAAIGRSGDEAFLAARAENLMAVSREPALADALRVPGFPGWAVPLGGGVALVAGWGLAALGQEREINLLSLPLIAILVWNAVVLGLSLVHGSGAPASRPAGGGWLASFLERWCLAPAAAGGAESAGAIRSRFRELVSPVLLRRAGFRFRAWLHLGAALLAFGGITGMYARGWSREYRAVWESTLLGESGARTFFGTLFAPASRVTGVAVPLDEVEGMRRHAETPAVRPGAALPWIHLYAATLGLLVIGPRLLFALLEFSRAARVPALELRSPSWRDYAAGVRAAAAGDGVSAAIVAHALASDEAARERWRSWLRTRWRDAASIDQRSVAPGGEAEFTAAWSPPAPRLLLVFNMATTPEIEVHRALAEGLLRKLRAAHPAGVLLLALDDTELKKRWSGFGDAEARCKVRREAWHEVLKGVGGGWI